MMARPWRGEVGDHRVDLGLGLHVDALGRLVQDQHARLGRQPLGQHDLLLVAAGQRLDRLEVAPEPQPQPVEMAAHEAQLACRADQAGRRSPGRSPAGRRWRGSRSPSPGSGRSGPPRRRRCPAAMASPGEANATSRPSSCDRARRSAGRRRTARARSRCGRCRPGRRSPGSRRRAPRSEMSAKAPSRARPVAASTTAPGAASRSGYMWLSERPTISRTARSRGISSVGAVATSWPSRSTVTRSATR